MTQQLSPMWAALTQAMVRIQARPKNKTVSTPSHAETAKEKAGVTITDRSTEYQ